MKYVLFVAFVLTIYVANFLVKEFGVVGVGFGYSAPAGVFVAGLAFTLRDLLHAITGRAVVLAAIAVGALLSLAIGETERIALASAVAFTTSEIIDLLVYIFLRKSGWIIAVLASNMVSLFVDSVIFLMILFGSLEFLPGQLLGKTYMTLLAVAVLYLVRKSYEILPRNSHTTLAKRP